MRFDKKFFEKHQSTLLKIANSSLTRWLLGLHRLPEPVKESIRNIERINPSGVTYRTKDRKIKSACFTRPRFAEALAYNLSPFVYFQMASKPVWRFSPVGVFGMLAVVLMPKVGFLGFIGTVSTLYPSAGDGTTSNQGLTAGKTWTNCRNGTGGTLVAHYTSTTWNDNNFGYGAGRLKDGNNRWVLFRDHCPIDTSVVGTDTINSATLNLKPNAHASGGGDSAVITASTVSSTTALVGSDFNQVGFTAWSNAINFADLVDGTYSVFTLNASGLAGINKTGYSHFALMSTADQSNSEPGAGTSSSVMMRSSEYAGTTSDPYIEITHVVSATIVTPSALALTSAVLAPSVSGTANISPSALALTSAVLAPSAIVGDSFSPSAQALTLTLQTPNILAGKIATPDALTLTSAILAPSLSLGRGVPVSAVSLTSATNSVTFLLGQTVFPSVIALTLSLQTIGPRWNPRTKPSSSWTKRTPPTTTWT